MVEIRPEYCTFILQKQLKFNEDDDDFLASSLFFFTTINLLLTPKIITQSDIILFPPNAIYFEASLRCCGNLVSCAICAVLFSMKCEEAITVSRVGDSGFRTGFGLLHWGRLGKCEIDVILLVFFQDFLIETK